MKRLHAEASEPVTVVVRRRIRHDAYEAFDRWTDGILKAAASFDGHLGAHLIRPVSANSQQDHVLIFSFDSPRTLAVWEQSDERARWLKQLEPWIQDLPASTR